MARIRTIKPELPQSESMGRVSRDARLLFIELWTICDDHGKSRGNSRALASLLFPYDDDAPGLIDGWLSELEREGSIVRYQVDGDSYIKVVKWTEHQRVDKPSPSRFPDPRECSRKPRENSLRTKEGTTREDSEPKGSDGGAVVMTIDPRKSIFDDGLPWLAGAAGKSEASLRSNVAKWCHAYGDELVLTTFRAAMRAPPVEPVSWIENTLKAKTNAQRNQPASIVGTYAELVAGDASGP